MKTIRRLARELVIFALVAAFVGGIVGVVMQHHTDQQSAASPNGFVPPAGTSLATPQPDPYAPYGGKAFPTRPQPPAPPIPPAKPPLDVAAYAFMAAGYASLGALGGIVLWLGYRIIRFAIKG